MGINDIFRKYPDHDKTMILWFRTGNCYFLGQGISWRRYIHIWCFSSSANVRRHLVSRDSRTSDTCRINLLPVAMTEFWLISAPGEKTCQQTWDKLMVATTRTNNLSTNNKFNIPDLKVRHTRRWRRSVGCDVWSDLFGALTLPPTGWNSWCPGGSVGWAGQTGYVCGRVNVSIFLSLLTQLQPFHLLTVENHLSCDGSNPSCPLWSSVVKKVAQYMADVLEDSRDKVQENLLANGRRFFFNTHNNNKKNTFYLHLFAFCGT